MTNGANREHGSLPTPSGQFSNRCFVPSDAPMVEGDRGRTREQCWTEFFGFYARVLVGTICRLAIRPIKPVIGATNTGRGPLTRLLQKLAEDLRDLGKLDLSESFNDASFSGAKKGALVGPTKRGKGSKIMAIADGHGFPLAVYVVSASPHETLDQRFLADLPARMTSETSTWIELVWT